MEVLPKIRPRDWQVKALESWCQNQRGIVKVVTGGGKTVFAYLCLQEFFKTHPNGRAFIVVPTTALLDQWVVDICFATTAEENDVATYSGKSKAEQLAKLNILVINTARTLIADLIAQERAPTMIVVDECHRAGAEENSKALVGDHIATLGLSATPEREFDDGFDKLLVPALGPIIFEYGYADAHRDGVIVDFDLVNVELNSAPRTEGSDRFISKVRLYKGGGRSEADMERAEERSKSLTLQALRIPWTVKLAQMHPDERIIIFHERVSSLEKIVSLLKKTATNVVMYHSRLSQAHRRDNLRLFREGRFTILATCRALDEGANIPEASVAIIAHSTRSTRQRIQRLGRVLRKSPNKDTATIYTVYVGEEEKERLMEEEIDLVGIASADWMVGAQK